MNNNQPHDMEIGDETGKRGTKRGRDYNTDVIQPGQYDKKTIGQMNLPNPNREQLATKRDIYFTKTFFGRGVSRRTNKRRNKRRNKRTNKRRMSIIRRV